MTDQDLDLKSPFFIGQDGRAVNVGWVGGVEQRCQCGSEWGPLPGRVGVSGCLSHPLAPGHDVMIERVVGDGRAGLEPPPAAPREASAEALVTLRALRVAAEAFLAALERADGVLRAELVQNPGPSVLAGIQGRVHDYTDAITGDEPSGPIPVKLAVRGLIRRIREEIVEA